MALDYNSLLGLDELDPLTIQRMRANALNSSGPLQSGFGPQAAQQPQPPAPPQPQPPAPAQPQQRPLGRTLTSMPTAGVDNRVGPTVDEFRPVTDRASLIPPELREQIDAEGRAGARAPYTPKTTPTSGSAADPSKITFQSVMAELEKLRGEQPNEEKLLADQRRREEGGGRDFTAAMALQAFGGQSFQPIAQHVLTRALKARDDYEIPGGWGTVSGEGVSWNPEKQRETKLKHLEFQAAQLRAEQQHQESLAQRAETARNTLASREAIAAARGGKEPNLQPMGTTPDGRQVSFDKTTGQRVIINADGSRQVYGGPMMSQARLDEQAEKVTQALHRAETGRNLLSLVKENPKAFGGIAALAPYTGNYAGARIQAANLTPKELQVRSLVLQEAAQLVNQLYGAALSAREDTRASAFVYNASDPPEILMPKLMAAIAYAEHKSKEFGQGVRDAGVQRQGGEADADAPPPGAVRPIERRKQ